MSIIYETSDYSKFKFIQGNRPVNNGVVYESIKEKNLLRDHPIIVNKDYQVIDGQHRLAAAEKLKLPIYYIISQDYERDDLYKCQVSKLWKLQDYCNFYIHKPEYKFVEEMRAKTKYQLHMIVECCTMGTKYSVPFKKGKLKLSQKMDVLIEKFEQMMQLTDFIKRIVGETKTLIPELRALWHIINMENYDHHRMLHKFNINLDNLKMALRFKHYVHIRETILEKVYNYKTINDNYKL